MNVRLYALMCYLKNVRIITILHKGKLKWNHWSYYHSFLFIYPLNIIIDERLEHIYIRISHGNNSCSIWTSTEFSWLKMSDQNLLIKIFYRIHSWIITFWIYFKQKFVVIFIQLLLRIPYHWNNTHGIE